MEYLSLLHLLLLYTSPSGNTTVLSRSKRVPAVTHWIVPPSEVEPVENVLDLEELRSTNLANYIGTVDDVSAEGAMKALKFLARFSLINNERTCKECGGRMSLVKDFTSAKADKRSESFFEGSHLTIQQILYLAASWVETPEKKVTTVALDMSLSVQTVVDFYQYFRDMSQIWFEREAAATTTKLGGVGRIVEIDETLLFRAKYSRGRMLLRPQIWIFGLIERGTNKLAMFRVARRDKNTLLPLIEAHVAPGTTIVSDGWAAYGGISALQAGYNHLWVNHRTNFVHPTDRRAHTQSIEATWGALKRQLKTYHGISENNIEGYLYSYMFRRSHSNYKLLNRLLVEINLYRREASPLVAPQAPLAPAIQQVPQQVLPALIPAVPAQPIPVVDSDSTSDDESESTSSESDSFDSHAESRTSSDSDSSNSIINPVPPAILPTGLRAPTVHPAPTTGGRGGTGTGGRGGTGTGGRGGTGTGTGTGGRGGTGTGTGTGSRGGTGTGTGTGGRGGTGTGGRGGTGTGGRGGTGTGTGTGGRGGTGTGGRGGTGTGGRGGTGPGTGTGGRGGTGTGAGTATVGQAAPHVTGRGNPPRNAAIIAASAISNSGSGGGRGNGTGTGGRGGTGTGTGTGGRGGTGTGIGAGGRGGGIGNGGGGIGNGGGGRGNGGGGRGNGGGGRGTGGRGRGASG